MYKQYVWSLRYIDAPVVRFRDADTDGDVDDTLYYFTDANFNVTALVDASDGDMVERYAYDPYGKVTVYDGSWANPTGSSAYDNAILYCGYLLDTETSLYHVRRRYYHPTLGRWTSRDPKDADKVSGGYHDGMNLYQYAKSHPGLSTDPSGRSELGYKDYMKFIDEEIKKRQTDFNAVFQRLIREYFNADKEDDWFWDCQDDMEEIWEAMYQVVSRHSGPGSHATLWAETFGTKEDGSEIRTHPRTLT